ncbi:flagellar motor protein MotB [Flavobacteriaceae bacterium AU392]|nr:flagellar motor protein MotB [Flavobacteriaceae bacterium]RKM81144.1 flagellar motor protein MotB [Flavobacteriaceae bacterium AU392]
MKAIKNTFLLSLLILVSVFTDAQNSKAIEKGNTLFKKYAYDEAIKVYLEALDNDERSTDLFANLADSYYENADMQNAVKWYDTLFMQDRSLIKGEYYFRYSQALKAKGEYDKADLWLERLAELNSDDSRAASLKYDIDYLKKIEKQSGRYETNLASINTPYSDFAANYGDKNILFSSARDKGVHVKRSHTWTGLPFLELFSAQVDENGNLIDAKKLKGDFNSKYNESTAIVTRDGNTMYFTRNSYDEGYQKDRTGIIRLKLYKSTKVDSTWGNIIELPFNNTEYSVAHPSLSSDEKKLYFASDMPGGVGLSDIYVVDINDDGTYGAPKNLGNKINTEGRDTFPFISKKGDLYFSSDGHLGLGGLDVFVMLNPENPEYPASATDKIFNVGRPINGEKDDFAFVINNDTDLGYFTSNRDGGVGSDDIYTLKELESLRFECTTEVTGKVVNEKTGKAVSNATIVVSNTTNSNTVFNLTSDANGDFTFEIDCLKENTYKITVEKERFIGNEDTFTVNPKSGSTLPVNLKLTPILGADLFKLLNLDQIYFDYNDDAIRPDAEIELTKIIEFLRENPSVKIDVRSHTDSRGSEKFNLRLSKRRNASTIEYIINKGEISSDRITGNGYGETQLLNKCADDIECSDEEHDINRRSEFIVIKD